MCLFPPEHSQKEILKKVTLVLGASSNPERIAYHAIINLQRRKVPVVAIGRKEDSIGDLRIRKGMPGDVGPVHTISMYMNAANQAEFYDYIFSLKPVRIIFNPGTFNPELSLMAMNMGIEVVEDCMLVMLRTRKF